MDKLIISKLKKSGLTGRGGACFPTALKWEMVAKAKVADKYVVCNGSEGEPGPKKDLYILENYPEQVINGMMLAIEYLGAAKGFLFLNEIYYKKLEIKLKKIIGDKPIELFKKPHSGGYIGGEETALLNSLEHKRIEPRLKPPFPPTAGYKGKPTLVNNVETFYDVSLISENRYKEKRFITINGDCLWTGVFELSEKFTIEKILRLTKNYPKFEFFVQVGGDASGEILNARQLKRMVSGSASITVYSTQKHVPLDLMRKWAIFFNNESCGQCTPCREGTYRLRELLFAKEPDWQRIADLLNSLSESSFCGLGSAAAIAISTYVNNVLSKSPKNSLGIKPFDQQLICECLK
ncbi:hypothetical protein K8R32_04430 [bacterium]|nr:hypothetical protein [bacterium]